MSSPRLGSSDESIASAAGVVSVIIPCYNHAHYVPVAIRSALEQTYRPLDVVVINDGSTDAFDQAIAPFRSQIEVIDQPNRGLTAARNRGIRDSQSEFVAFLDADDMWEPDKIARQVSLLQSLPDHALVHTRTAFVGPSGESIARQARPWHDRPLQGTCTLELLAHNTIAISSVLVRRSALGVAPFSIQDTASDDWGLWLRLSLRYPFAFIDETLTWYRIHDSNMSRNVRLMDTSTVRVREHFLAQDLPHDVRRTARRLWRHALLDMAHIEYESGNLTEARRLFTKAGHAMRGRDWLRFMVTMLPRQVALVRHRHRVEPRQTTR